MSKIQFSKNGFSLIEIMVSLGLMSLLIAAALSVSSYFSEIKKSNKAMSAQWELQRGLESALKMNCKCNYANPGSELTYSGTGDLTLTTLKYYSDCATPLDMVVDATGNLPWSTSNVKVTAMKIINILPNGTVPNSYVGDLKVDMTSGTAVMAPYKTISKPFTFTRNSASPYNLTDCAYSGGSSSSSSGSATTNNSLTVADKITLSGRFTCTPASGTVGTDVCNCQIPVEPFNTLPNSKKLFLALANDTPNGQSCSTSATMPTCPTDYLPVSQCNLYSCCGSCNYSDTHGSARIVCMYNGTW